MLLSILAIGLGAAIGALLRWALGLWLNGLTAWMPMGTLAANLVGGWGIGVAVMVFAQQPGLPDPWRLFVITGLLGGLTTFSTFSAEIVAMLQTGRLTAAALAISAHLGGSLLMTVAGMATVQAWRRL